jgi:hypothetical protein
MKDRRAPFVRGAIVVAMVALLLPSWASPSAAADPIQPGDLMVAGGTQCTLNFVYDGTGSQRGNVYLGTAAHCVNRVGERVSDGAGRVWGSVAFMGSARNLATDFAFIRVFSQFKSAVRASVKGHTGAPRGVASATGASFGDPVLVSGYGQIFRPVALAREQRRGVLLTGNAQTFQAEVPIFFGDSGGPVVHLGGNRALGIVSVVCLGTCGLARGPMVRGVIAKAAARGFHVQLRTVGGSDLLVSERLRQPPLTRSASPS